jgi:predicted membrane-bound mannosyltransferase
MPYVYAHTKRGFLDLIREIERYAEKSGKGKQASVEVVSSDYWSMPWYTRDYPKVIFHGKLADANTSEMVVASEAQKSELAQRYAAHYKFAGKYPLRPGVELYLLVRKDLADAGARDIYNIGEVAP